MELPFSRDPGRDLDCFDWFALLLLARVCITFRNSCCAFPSFSSDSIIVSPSLPWSSPPSRRSCITLIAGRGKRGGRPGWA